MNRRAIPCMIAAAGVLAVTGLASASTTGIDLSPPKTSSLLKPPTAGWRGFKTEGGGFQLVYSPEGPGPSSLSLSCQPPASTVEIQAPAIPGTSGSAAIRITSGGFVRVYFAKQSPDPNDGIVTTRTSVGDEMLQMFRKTGRIVAGRANLYARTPSEKAAIEDFFAGCAPESVAKP